MENLTRDRTMEVCLEVMSKTIMANFRDKSKPFSCGEVHRAASAIGIAEYKVFAFYVGIFKEYLEEIGQRDFSEIIQGFEISEDDRKQISYFLVRDDVLGKKKLDIFISSITTEDTRELEKAGGVKRCNKGPGESIQQLAVGKVPGNNLLGSGSRGLKIFLETWLGFPNMGFLVEG